jgi:biopolymer transport protein ExbD
MKFPRNATIFRGRPDATPFIGVLFLLSLFCLLSSSLVFLPGVPIQLPEASESAGITNRTVAVAVDRKGRLYFENQIIEEQVLGARLREAAQKAPTPLTLVLLADVNVPLETTVRLLRMARASGIPEGVLAARPASTSGRSSEGGTP